MSRSRHSADDKLPVSRTAHALTDSEISEFLLKASHDLRGAARTIRTHSELCLRGGLGEVDLSQEAGFLVNACRRIDLLLDALVSYSLALQMEASSSQTANMNAVLRTALARLAAEIRHNGAEVKYDDLPRVWGNPDRLAELLERLISNALRHRGPAAPRIEIRASQVNGALRFEVVDNGPGVETPYLERIFKAFERLDGGPDAGAGMGLAICRMIVEKHGGTIWAESEGPGGARFCFTLPAEPS